MMLSVNEINKGKDALGDKQNHRKQQNILFEMDNVRYFDSIAAKPTLYLEISYFQSPLCHLSIRNAIVLSLFERFCLAEWIDLHILCNEECGGDTFHKSGHGQQKPSRPYRVDDDIYDSSDIENEQTTPLKYESIIARKDSKLFESFIGSSVGSIVKDIGLVKHPSIFVHEKRLIISGLSSVIRFLLKFCTMRIRSQVLAEQNNENLLHLQLLQQQLHDLMGFRGSCLQACAETSLWVKFCEVDIIRMVIRILSKVANSTLNTKWEIANELIRFEYHLSQPVRIHNFRKRVQAENHKLQQQQQITIASNIKEDVSHLSHCFAEGPDMTLSDLIVYHCIKIAMDFYGTNIFEKHLPKTLVWYKSVRLYFHSSEAGDVSIISSETAFSSTQSVSSTDITVPEVPFESLYKTDPSRCMSKLQYTKQDDIDKAMELVLAATEIFDIIEIIPAFDWSTVPRLAHPEGGQLPEKRKSRKCHQLANLAQEVLAIYEEKRKSCRDTQIRIVDFCSGGGHLGILLAWLLPQSQVIMVENKEDSIRRAEERVGRLGLMNVFLHQSNLNYFNGRFDIGVALHACGCATDLVLEKCIAARACFVCCPCCYGAIRSNHVLRYPRSSTFCGVEISLNDYFVLVHSADQTHEDSSKSVQGKLCMRIVDTDRLLSAKEQNYSVILKRMVPNTASPKNHILVGIPNNSA